MPRFVFRVVRSAALCALIYPLIALGLVASQIPSDGEADEATPNQASGEGSISFQNRPQISKDYPISTIQSRNGDLIRFRYFSNENPSAPIVIILHGSGWYGGGYLDIAAALARIGDYMVLVPDLRGHGKNPIRRGDVDYIGQLEDDLADLINSFDGQNREVVMIGHSSGGGLAIRFAGGEYGDLLDSAVLLAPYLHHNSPTMRPNSGGWAKPLKRRIIGLSMLNMIGVSALNHLQIIQFNFPQDVLDGPFGENATTAYSYRLNSSFAPRNDFENDLAKLPVFLTLIGENDDAFIANMFEPVMSAASSNGSYAIIPQTDHLGILSSEDAIGKIRKFLAHDPNEISKRAF